MHHHNELNVTKELATGSCIAVWVKRLASNEIEWGIGVKTIESRASNVPIDKGNCIRGCQNPRHRGSSDEIIVEHVGANMGIQIPLLVIDRRGVSVMSACLPEPVGSTHLRFGDARVVEIWLCSKPKVVRGRGWDPRRHEEFRNGPEVKNYIWEVEFRPSGKFRGLF